MSSPPGPAHLVGIDTGGAGVTEGKGVVGGRAMNCGLRQIHQLLKPRSQLLDCTQTKCANTHKCQYSMRNPSCTGQCSIQRWQRLAAWLLSPKDLCW